MRRQTALNSQRSRQQTWIGRRDPDLRIDWRLNERDREHKRNAQQTYT